MENFDDFNSDVGTVIVLVGPTCCGKSTVMKYLEQSKNVEIAHSTTTRPMRPGESEGNPYHFVSIEKFNSMIENDELFEYAAVHSKDTYYGLEKKYIEPARDPQKIVVKDVDVQGLPVYKEELKTMGINCISVFIDISLEDVEKRLAENGDRGNVEDRLKSYPKEIKHKSECDFVVATNNKEKDISKKIAEQILKKEHRLRIQSLYRKWKAKATKKICAVFKKGTQGNLEK